MPHGRPFIAGFLIFALAISSVSAQSRAAAAPNTPLPKPTQTSRYEGQKLPQDEGRLGYEAMLRKLRTTARLMHTTAHPDDEDGGMLVMQSRRYGAETMLFTLTRGDGGQNKTGSNLFDELGVLRTLELMASGRYYGVHQRFSRVADFGFTKSSAETLEKWQGKENAMAEMVRVIREFRPDVIVSRFQGGPGDGHGQHQAAGLLTPEAYEAAADASRFPEQIKQGLAPHQTAKLFRGTRDMAAGDVTLNVGEVYLPLGKSFIEFGIEGYSHQKSQSAQVFPVAPGTLVRHYKLLDWRAGGIQVSPKLDRQDFFSEINVTLGGLARRLGEDEKLLPRLRGQLETADAATANAVEAKDDMAKAARELLSGLRLIEAALKDAQAAALPAEKKADLLVRLETKRGQFNEAARLALALDFQLTRDSASEAVFPGDTIDLKARLNIPAGGSVERIKLHLPDGWQQDVMKSDLRAGEANFRVWVPKEAELTRPFWHRDDPEHESMHKIENEKYLTLPLPPPQITATATYSFAGLKGKVQAVARVEKMLNRRALAVLPKLSVLMQHAARIVPLGKDEPVAITVNLRNVAETAGKGSVRLRLPEGWKTAPEVFPFDISAATKDSHFRFLVTPTSAKESSHRVSAEVSFQGTTYSQGFSTVSREDLDTFYYFQPASQNVTLVNVKLPQRLRVGYIMGAGDDIPTVLRQLGMNVEDIDPGSLATLDLKAFDTIVVGIRAYETQEGVKKNNPRLLKYVEEGGRLIVQNNSSTQEFNAGNYTPYPAQLSRERVSVESAPVELLVPDDPIFLKPNRITANDFDGWVQERGVNFMSSWDSRFQPLMASSDPGEARLKGGMLQAKYGQGTYIYTGYAFFRQLPAGVPGAIRLYINLLGAHAD